MLYVFVWIKQIVNTTADTTVYSAQKTAICLCCELCQANVVLEMDLVKNIWWCTAVKYTSSKEFRDVLMKGEKGGKKK